MRCLLQLPDHIKLLHNEATSADGTTLHQDSADMITVITAGTALYGTMNSHSTLISGFMQIMSCSGALDHPDERVDHG